MTNTPRGKRFHDQFKPATVEAPPPVAVVDDEGPRKVTRKPFGSMSLKLAYEQREGFHRHWFNDTPGRIGRAQEAGYEHVKDAAGKNVSRVVGTAEGGGALTGFLMEIPEAFYQEDMAAQQRTIDEKEEAIKRGIADSTEGDGRYVPSQGISIGVK